MTKLCLQTVLGLLEKLSPLDLAGDWDNVGLLVGVLEPADHAITRVLLTIDATDAVIQEALDEGCDLVVAYHPPIFQPIRRLDARPGVGRAVLRAARHGLPIWSPHTALDAVPGGVNDWLASAFERSERTVIEPSETVADAGQGRLLQLHETVPVAGAVETIKRHLGLDKVRIASPTNSEEAGIRTIALCPGAGGSVVTRCTDADLLWTGEMRHHDVLQANANGQHVVLCEHTNTERGYLPYLAERLVHSARSQGVPLEVRVSRRDRDPHEVV